MATAISFGSQFSEVSDTHTAVATVIMHIEELDWKKVDRKIKWLIIFEDVLHPSRF